MLKFLYVALTICVCASTSYEKWYHNYTIQPGQTVSCENEGKKPVIYCYPGTNLSLKDVWKTVYFQVSLKRMEYEQYEGRTMDEVIRNYESRTRFFSWDYWKILTPYYQTSSSTTNTHYVNPFNVTCLGILSYHGKHYDITLKANVVDTYLFGQFLLGTLLFVFGRHFSEMEFFYYAMCVILGVTCSFLIVAYFVVQRLPGKNVWMYGIVGGSTISLFIFRFVVENTKYMVMRNPELMLAYISLSGGVSFVYAYWKGPPESERSRRLLRWSLQGVGLVLIYFSTYIPDVARVVVAVALLIKCSRYFSMAARYAFWPLVYLINLLGKLISFKRPPVVKLLSREQYKLQGEIETRKGLEELKGYCGSPEAQPWKIVEKLRDPKRFARFVEGNSHVSEDEIMEHSRLKINADEWLDLITDDDSDDY